MDTVESLLQEWDDLNKEFLQLEEKHRTYMKKVDEVKAIQNECVSGINHQRHRIKQIVESLKSLSKNASSEQKGQVEEVLQDMKKRKLDFREMEEVLPHKNGIYLSIVLGQVNISLLSKADKFKYKQDYEKFKLVVTLITVMIAFGLLTFLQYYRAIFESIFYSACGLVGILVQIALLVKYEHQINRQVFMDAAFHFLLVWYYCTLTIRENILIVNGSRIKGWWLTHHFISTVCAGIMLIWPDGVTYRLFRTQFLWFVCYLGMVQVVQYYYQRGCLYRLRALGERHNMDITVDGFQSWMWKGLSFVLPFLFTAYFFQFYNAYTLYHLSYHPECVEWQVPVVAFIFLVLASCNTFTCLGVIRQKLNKEAKAQWRKRYSTKLHKCKNNHIKEM